MKAQRAKTDAPVRDIEWFAREAVKEHPDDLGAALAKFKAIEDDPRLLIELVGRETLNRRETDYLRVFWQLARPRPRPDADAVPGRGNVTPLRRPRRPAGTTRTDRERMRHDLEDAGIYASHLVADVPLGICKRVTLVTEGRKQTKTGAFYLALAGLLPDEHQTVREAIPLAEAERLYNDQLFSALAS